MIQIKICFFTSSPTGPLDGSRKVTGFDEMNGFRNRLAQYWKPASACLMVASDPHNRGMNTEMTDFFHKACEESGLNVSRFDILDDYRREITAKQINSYDVIFLGGGHVPTQNRFFSEINLREKIKDFDGIIIGISAGSMNSADTVYAQPELEGESVNPDYIRFMPGLGLTKTMILPHYQMVKDNYLDGRRLFEDITIPDSAGRPFTVISDGSYIFSKNGQETLFGDAWKIENCSMYKICSENESIKL